MTIPAAVRSKPYAETFRCPGGDLCLDFCNTGQGAKGSSKQEWIARFDDLMLWLEASGALARPHVQRLRAQGERLPQAARALHSRALDLRAALAGVFLAKAQGHSIASDALHALEAEYARTAPFARLTRSDGGFRWGVDERATVLESCLQPIVASATALLTSPRLARLRRCGNATCYWLFIDETKNCSRRWCEMASCGNLMKVRRHRERAAGKSSAEGARDP